jgi:hypothetical protein
MQIRDAVKLCRYCGINEKTQNNNVLEVVMWFIKFIRVFVLTVILTISSTAAYAMENGTSSMALGTEEFLPALGPGFNIVNNLNYRHNTALMDKDGNKLPVPFDAKISINATRFIYNSEIKLFGGSLGAQIIPPLVHLSLETPGGKDSAAGIGDIIVGVNNGHHSKNWHIIYGMDLKLPTGDYDKNEIANIGSNYFTVEPFAIVQYISDGGFEIGAKFMYDYSTENNDTNYHSGQEIQMNYMIGQHFGPLSVGFYGYLYRQITDDEVNGIKINDYKAKSYSAGPAVMYTYKRAAFTLKYIKDFEVENMAKGEQISFKVNFSF